jgi:hypothetical protein
MTLIDLSFFLSQSLSLSLHTHTYTKSPYPPTDLEMKLWNIHTCIISNYLSKWWNLRVLLKTFTCTSLCPKFSKIITLLTLNVYYYENSSTTKYFLIANIQIYDSIHFCTSVIIRLCVFTLSSCLLPTGKVMKTSQIIKIYWIL